MSNKDILTKIRNSSFYLDKITAKKINKKPDYTQVNINQHTVCTILEGSGDNLLIKVNIKTFLEPEALFSIEMEYIMEFEFKEEITDKEIKDNIDEIIAPLGRVSSYIIASITKEMLGSYMILPPIIKANEIERINK
jgi:hypothetical protein